MISTTREGLAEAVENLRKALACDYLSQDHCDCKFGGHLRRAHRAVDGKTMPPKAIKEAGESTLDVMQKGEGACCPELRSIAALLTTMTDHEYEILRARVEGRKVQDEELYVVATAKVFEGEESVELQLTVRKNVEAADQVLHDVDTYDVGQDAKVMLIDRKHFAARNVKLERHTVIVGEGR